MISSLPAHLQQGDEIATSVKKNLSVPQNFAHAGQVHPHAEVPIAAVLVEPISLQVDGHERHMGSVHCLAEDVFNLRKDTRPAYFSLRHLQLNSPVSAIPGSFCQEVLQGFHHLLQQVSLDKSGLEHADSVD